MKKNIYIEGTFNIILCIVNNPDYETNEISLYQQNIGCFTNFVFFMHSSTFFSYIT
jgi:hypothetical protein